VHQIGNYYIA